MNLPDKRICLWLDDAGRFIDALDARALQSLKDLTSGALEGRPRDPE